MLEATNPTRNEEVDWQLFLDMTCNPELRFEAKAIYTDWPSPRAYALAYR